MSQRTYHDPLHGGIGMNAEDLCDAPRHCNNVSTSCPERHELPWSIHYMVDRYTLSVAPPCPSLLSDSATQPHACWDQQVGGAEALIDSSSRTCMGRKPRPKASPLL